MNKQNVLAVIVCLLAVFGCAKFGSNDKSKTSPTPYKDYSAANTVETPTGNVNKTSSTTSGNSELARLEEAAVKNPKDYDAHFQLGVKYQSSKMEEKAVGAYKKAVEIKPDSHEANYALGKIYLDKKDFQTSLPFLQKAAKIKDTSAEYLVALGDNYRELKKCDYAMPPYGNSINYNDKNPAAYYGMGLCYLELNNRLAADAQIRPLEKLDKNLAKQLEIKVKQK